MKKLILALIIYIFLKIFRDYASILIYINDITYLFFKRIFPSLFIFFTISSLLLNLGLVNYLSNSIGSIISKVFNISKNSAAIFMMSIISGFPSNSKYIKELLDKNIINNKEASKLLLFTHFANPLFIISLVPNMAYLIIFSHYITNIILGLIFRNYHGKFQNMENIYNEKNINFFKILNNSLKDTIDIILNILGIIVFFYLISITLNISFLTYVLEMTSSITYILNTNIPIKYQYMLITGILSFGGLSIHMQVFSILDNKKIRYLPYFLARILHFIISSVIFLILY